MNGTRRDVLRTLLLGLLTPPSLPGQRWRGLLQGIQRSVSLESPRPEDLSRLQICLNGDWQIVRNAADERVPDTGWTSLRVPAMPLIANPHVGSAWYRQNLQIPKQWRRAGRRFFLRIEKVGHYAAIYCNGHLAGEHYGQYTPFEADITDDLRVEDLNQIAIYVHDASGRYARPGVVLTDPMEGNAYRGATNKAYERNWIGITGDIFLGWRSATRVSDIFIVTSVRNRHIHVDLHVQGVEPNTNGLTLRAAVLDGGKVVRSFPDKSVTANGVVGLESDWADPVLWGPEPYGKPMLYELRTELVKQGELVDRNFTRFGFREVWIEGRNVLLNGKTLWAMGTYFEKLAPICYLNDRHPQALMIEVMQKAGLNMLHGHWDDLGEAWLNQCDERGMLVLGEFFCDGRPDIQSRADSGWVDWMVSTCGDWVNSVRNHPSIILWRPNDSVPSNLAEAGEAPPSITHRMADQVRRRDGTRPLVDDSDIATWWQGPFKNQAGPFALPAATGFDDGSEMVAALAASKKPFLTREIYTPFPMEGDKLNALQSFFRNFYARAFMGRSTGIIVQHIPLVRWEVPFRISWLSESGRGNRNSEPEMRIENLPNWCDDSQPLWVPTPYNPLFAKLYLEWMKISPAAYSGDMLGEILVGGLDADEIVFLIAEDPARGGATALRVASDGTAWIVGLDPGPYRLTTAKRSIPLQVQAQKPSTSPGYHAVQRIEAT